MGLNEKDITLALTGEVLMAAMHTAKEQRRPIAESLFYENTISMISAEPGLGKSTLLTQVAVELSSGIPVFGHFPVPRPFKVLFCQNERPILEFLERLEVINKSIAINPQYLHITDEYKIFNLMKEDHVNLLITCIKRDCPDVEVICMDPIYPLVPGGLSKDEPSALFCKAMSLVQKETGAALLYAHHTTKPQHKSTSGEVIEKDDPYFGTVWLKAHVTGSYQVKKTETGVELHKKKDNYRAMVDNVKLEYNSETGLSAVATMGVSALERAKDFLRTRKYAGNEPFSFADFSTGCNVSVRCARELLSAQLIKDQLIVVSAIRNKNLYKVI